MENDDLRDIAIRIVDRLVEERIIRNCIDTNWPDEFEVQDIIVEELQSICTLDSNTVSLELK
tara:strand:- start:4712 stop:4897 length:186 start_codon:yes stop_codon:yes gene_type:complete